jgi:hypothetical protein
MQQEARSKQDFLNNLYWKWFLADMKTRLVQMICCLMEEQHYSKEEITASLMDLVAFIELEEKMADTNKIKERYLAHHEIS